MKKLLWSWTLFLVFQISFSINLVEYPNAVFTIQGTNLVSGQTYGIPVLNAGDINGDGKDDFLIGASGHLDSDQNGVFLVYGGTDVSSINLNFKPNNLAITPSSAGTIIKSHASSDGFGFSVSSVGDINGDGKADFMIGAHRKEFYRGFVYVIYGKGAEGLPNSIDLKDVDLETQGAGFIVKGETEHFYLGNSISSAGHFTSTSFDDIVIGVRGIRTDTGAIVVIYGASTQRNITLKSDGTLDRPSTGFSIFGAAQKDYFGYSVSSAGDINKDGHNDIIIGAPSRDGVKIGKAYVIYGGKTGNLDLTSSTLPIDRGFKITGIAVGDRLGCSVSGIGDINGDKVDDFIIGASGQDSSRGAAYIIYGSTDLTRNDIDLSQPLASNKGFIVRGKAANDQLGISVKGLGDLNGDGYADIMIGAQGQANANNGAVHMIYGGAALSEINLANTDLQPATNGFTIKQGGYFGFTVDSGDFLGNSNKDLFVGSYVSGVASTNVGYIIDLTKMCSAHCNQCTIPTTCRTCSNDYGVENSVCELCPRTSKYLSPTSGQCLSCMDHCDKCPDDQLCETCSQGYGKYEGKCVHCPLTTYLSDGVCLDCLDNCDVCQDHTACQTCKDEYGHYDGKCVKCPPKTFLFEGNCDECIENCEECLDARTCKTCSKDYGVENSICQLCPRKGKFLSPDNGQCLSCMENCDECSDNTLCSKCSDDHGYYEEKCVRCPLTTYLSDGVCLDCLDNCDVCQDHTACQTCTDEYGHYDGKCVKCPPKTFLFEGTCDECIENCEECLDARTCKTCSEDYGVEDSICKICPRKGKFLSPDNGECRDCMLNCDECSENSSCKTCSAEHGYYEEECVKCPATTYLSDGKCLSCQSHCDKCLDDQFCEICSEGYGKYEEECVKCPAKTFLSDGQCLPCVDNCETCSDLATCDKCLDDYGIENSLCKTCPRTGKFFLSETGECLDCLPNCDKCSDKSACETCLEDHGHYLGECVKCPLTTYLSTGVCLDCMENCDVCQDQIACQTCTEEYGYYNGKCVKCPPKTFLSDGQCLPCVDNCETCSDLDTCDKCSDDYGIENSVCESCPRPGKFFSTETGECLSCMPNCDKCSDDSACETCSEDHGHHEGECVRCPPTTYLSDGSCQPCIDDCDVCQNSSACQTCTEGFGLVDGKCVGCPSKSFLSNGECLPCIDNCEKCLDDKTCKTCSSDYGVENSICTTCPQTGKFLSPETGECLACMPNCDKCSDSMACETCSEDYGHYEGECVKCPATTYLSNGSCQPCIDDCDKCSDDTTCQSCTEGYGLLDGKCVGCPSKTFLSDGECLPCIDNCEKCLDDKTCKTCSSDYGVENSVCTTCPRTGKFLSSDTGECLSCMPNCDECSNDSACKTCSEEHGLYNGQCVKCPITTYLFNGECLPCIENCDKCSDDKTCQTCTAGSGYLDGKCIGCPSKSFLSNGECLPCIDNCEKCLDDKTCKTCSSDYGVENSVCKTCPRTGKFLSSDTGECLPCMSNCGKCSDDSTCETCSEDYGYYEGECVKCPATTYLSNGSCQPCIDDCDKCSDDTTCQTCTDGYGLLDGKCVGCPSKTFLSNGECLACIDNCEKCLDSTTCKTCSSEYGVENSVCEACPRVGKFLSSETGKCLACMSNCDECSDDSTCKTCSDGYGHFNGECVRCPITTYLSNGECLACKSNCDTCSDSKTCLTCTNGYGQLNGECVGCPLKTFLSTGYCLNCIRNCETCSDSISCQACSNGYGRSKSRQCELCPQIGKYLSSNGECLGCVSNCDQCSDSKSCQTCSAGYGRFNSTCVRCPSDGLFFANGTCFACSVGCSTCQDSLTCQVCAEGFMLSEWSTCVEKKETSAIVATSSTFEGASLIGASITAGGALPFNFGIASKMMRNIKYLDIPVSPELRKSFVSWKATSSFLSAPKSWNSNPNSEASLDSEGSLSSSGRLLSKSESNIGHLPKVFGRYGLESAFLINYWKTLILTLVGFVIFAIFKVIEVQITQIKSKWHSFARAVNVAASNFALTQFYSNLDDVVLYLSINARSSKTEDTSLDLVSMIIGGILLAIGAIFVAAHIWFLRRYQDLKAKQQESELEAFKSKTENISLIFKNFKDKGYATQSFLLISLIRSLVTSLIFTMLFEYPFLQVLFLLILTTAMIVFLLAVRPFKEWIETCGQFFSEFILLLVNICMFILCVFNQVGSEPLDAIDKLSKCVIVLNIILLVGCAIFLIISVLKMFYNIYKLYQEKKQSKNTSEVLTSLNKKLDGLKFSHPNTAAKTSNFEQSSPEISDSHVMLNPQQTYTKNLNETEQGNMLEQRHSTSFIYENQAEDIMDTSQEVNLNLSGFLDFKASQPKQKSPTKIKQEKKQALSTLNHKGVAYPWDIDEVENQTEFNGIPLQKFEGTFSKKKKQPKQENVEGLSHSGILSHEQGDHENKKQENGEGSSNSNSGALDHKEGQTQVSEVATTPQQNPENQKQELLNSGLLKNQEEVANMMDPWNIDEVEIQIESNGIPLQNSEAIFKKKKKVKNQEHKIVEKNSETSDQKEDLLKIPEDFKPQEKLEDNKQENMKGLSDFGILSPEGDQIKQSEGLMLQESLQDQPKKNEKEEIKGSEIINDQEDLDCEEKEDSANSGILKNHEEAQSLDPCNIDDGAGELESNGIPLQDSEGAFNKKKKVQKAENIKVQRMRE